MKERSRRERGIGPLEDLVQDVRTAFRSLRQKPGFTFIVVATLALGIGANTAIFSVLNGILLRPLPFPEADRLIEVCETHDQIEGFCVVSFVNAGDWNESADRLEIVGAARGWPFVLKDETGAVMVDGGLADAAFFDVFSLRPEAGRLFVADDEKPGSRRVVVLSHAVWQSRYGADPAAIGRSVTIGDSLATIVGVLPSGVKIPGLEDIELWMPIRFAPTEIANRRWRGFHGVARVRAGVDRREATEELRALAAGLAAAYPEASDGWGIETQSLHDSIVGSSRRALWVFMGAVGFVLLIGCANIANLTLARSASREREFAVRRSLGASRGRLVRLLVTESLVMSAIGAAAGVVLALWGVNLFVALAPPGVPRIDEVSVDGAALGFTIVLALATTILFGLLPALRSADLDLVSSLKSAGTGPVSGNGSGHGTGARRVLVIAEVALGMMLLVGAGLMSRTFLEVSRWDPGFERENLLTFWALNSSSRYEDGYQVADLFAAASDEIESIPEVTAVGQASAGPMFGGREQSSFTIDGRPEDPSGLDPVARWYDMDPGYFGTMGIGLVRGRYFRDADDRHSAQVVIINQTLADRYFDGQDPIGRRVRLEDREEREIVGIVADVPPFLPGIAVQPEMYWPVKQSPRGATYFLVRTTGDPEALAPAIRERLAALDPDLGIESFMTLTDRIGTRLVPYRFNMLLLSAFAGLALLLAAGGIYGVLAYRVSRRTHEIGLRKALGADDVAIARLVLRHGLGPAAVGLAVGIGGSLALTRLLEGMLYGVELTDKLTFAAVAALLAIVSVLACWMPARRAARLDPMQAMRVD